MLPQPSHFVPERSGIPPKVLAGMGTGEPACSRLLDMSGTQSCTRTARLVAVTYADVVGFSRMMCDDEEGTIARWLAVRRNILKPLIKANNGRLVNAIGDSFLAEFCDVAEAVAWGREVQRTMRNLETAVTDGEAAFKLRIAVHCCAVIAMQDDIFGVGINIVARLQTYAPPGGLIISGAAYDRMVVRPDVAVKALGALPLRNIAQPVHAYLL
ncbi:MAG: adenylate/guanylate cyclase domain-containing protein [Rhodospirillales bacterium]|nr:adenylate/guanylate cyclase domain-containing protein [Rhodospirillales bacterium]